MGERIPDEKRALIAADYAGGMSTKAIAEKHGIAQPTACFIAHAEGVPKRVRKYARRKWV